MNFSTSNLLIKKFDHKTNMYKVTINFKNIQGLFTRVILNIGFQVFLMLGFMQAKKAGLN